MTAGAVNPGLLHCIVATASPVPWLIQLTFRSHSPSCPPHGPIFPAKSHHSFHFSFLHFAGENVIEIHALVSPARTNLDAIARNCPDERSFGYYRAAVDPFEFVPVVVDV